MSESSVDVPETVEQASTVNELKHKNEVAKGDMQNSPTLTNIELVNEEKSSVLEDEVDKSQSTASLESKIEVLRENTDPLRETQQTLESTTDEITKINSNKEEEESQSTSSPLDTQIKQAQSSRTDVESENIAETLKTKTSNEQENSNTMPTAVKCVGKTKNEDYKKANTKDEYAEHVTYREDGTAIYTDPKTNFQYKWCTKENNWIAYDTTTSTNPYENEHYKWCSETQKWIPKQTQVTETEHYKWDAEKNQWVAKIKETAATTGLTNPAEIVYEIDENGQRTYTDKDGTVFFWDVEKNAWFPKIDDDFMARYQMSYGFIDNTSESEREKEKLELEAAVQKEKELARMVEEAKANEEASKEAAKQGVKRKQPQEPPKWFDIDPSQNTKVYVSNLPLDITLDEFAEVMSKCGMIMRDPQTQKYKLKLYTESDGQIKGDGLCDYIKVESVDLALNILDEYDLRGNKIRVQRAQFQMRGEYNPALKPKRKKKDKEKLAKIKEKLFDWRPEKMRGERSKHEKTVIIKNLFHPELFEKEVQLILDYQNDLREECSKCGTVRKVVIYDRHSEGVAQVNMSSPEEADLVIQMMHGRFFGKRQLTAEHWDGKTKYKVEETEEEIQKRLNKWDQYLETEENKKSNLQEEETKKVENTESQPYSETVKREELLDHTATSNTEETQKDGTTFDAI
ncbi:HIV Tat-specific factor 1 [Lucilia cuprina]|nr:HIV Tat-specific factor 1 [Lucilia cuprina]